MIFLTSALNVSDRSSSLPGYFSPRASSLCTYWLKGKVECRGNEHAEVNREFSKPIKPAGLLLISLSKKERFMGN